MPPYQKYNHHGVAWECYACGFWHRAEHVRCDWCAGKAPGKPFKDKTNRANSTWQAPPAAATDRSHWDGWQHQRQRGGKPKVQRPPKTQWPTQVVSTVVANRWSSLEDPDEVPMKGCEWAAKGPELTETKLAAPEEPTDTEIRWEKTLHVCGDAKSCQT